VSRLGFRVLDTGFGLGFRIQVSRLGHRVRVRVQKDKKADIYPS